MKSTGELHRKARVGHSVHSAQQVRKEPRDFRAGPAVKTVLPT